jgi:hypothetical protein
VISLLISDDGIHRWVLTPNTARCPIHKEAIELSWEELKEEEANNDDEDFDPNVLLFRERRSEILCRESMEGASE